MYALYARQSVEKPDSISIESQLEYCRYETKGQPYKTYVDRGFSGKDTHRPAFEQMLSDIRAGQIQTVVVYKLDRVSRSVLDFGRLMEEFEKSKVAFVSATEKFDTQTPMGRAMLNIAMVFAQLERETIQKRVADSYLARSRHGFYMGGRVPYGYRLEPAEINGVRTSVYVPEEKEAQQVKLIYSMYVNSDYSLGKILQFFEEHQIRHLRGGRWNTARLSELLRNPAYVKADAGIYRYYQSQGVEIINDLSDFQGGNGCYLYRQRKNDKKCAAFPKDTLVLAPHEGLVSSGLWLACRNKCGERPYPAAVGKTKSTWLAGKVKCGKCGYALTVKKSDTKMGRYFVCSAKYTAKGCTGAGTVYVLAVEDCLSEQIKKRLEQFQNAGFPEDNRDSQTSTYRQRIAKLEESIDRLVDRVERSTDAAMEEINRRINRLCCQKRELQEQLNALTQETVKQRFRKDIPLAAIWEETELVEKKEITDSLIQSVQVADDRIDIVWKI
ncbi:MAG: recombinase family protein [Ruminococcaceae bacterium]|jgi:DNA invertase Pin-like site-specific DNA recombinase|nr:recombinase family protein [Oscillospiraceae bacterium]